MIAIGPLIAEISSGGISVKALSSNTIVGMVKESDSSHYSMKLHPHTSSSEYHIRNEKEYLDAVFGMRASSCLGDAGSGLSQAFKNNEPTHVIHSALAWLTCANSADPWGGFWKHFPRVNEITNLEDPIDINELGIQWLREDLSKTSGHIMNKFFPKGLLENIQSPDDNLNNANILTSIEKISSFRRKFEKDELDEQLLEMTKVIKKRLEAAQEDGDEFTSGLLGYVASRTNDGTMAIPNMIEQMTIESATVVGIDTEAETQTIEGRNLGEAFEGSYRPTRLTTDNE